MPASPAISSSSSQTLAATGFTIGRGGGWATEGIRGGAIEAAPPPAARGKTGANFFVGMGVACAAGGLSGKMLLLLLLLGGGALLDEVEGADEGEDKGNILGVCEHVGGKGGCHNSASKACATCRRGEKVFVPSTCTGGVVGVY